MQTRANQLDLAWAAGFLDGEGCFAITSDRNNFQCLVDAGQVDPKPLLRLQQLFGGNVRFAPDKHGGHWQWRVYAINAAMVAEQLLPYLYNKAPQAALIIEFQKTKGQQGKRTSDEIMCFRKSLYLRSCDLKRRVKQDAERLNEQALHNEGDAIVRSHENNNHENTAEMSVSC